MSLHAVVLGSPVSMGSKRIGRDRNDRPIILDVKDKALRSWQADCRAALAIDAPPVPLDCAVDVRVEVLCARPASHHSTAKHAKGIKPNAPRWKKTKPDADKLLRGVLDCLTGCWITDDGRVARVEIAKRYVNAGEVPCTRIWLTELEEAE